MNKIKKIANLFILMSFFLLTAVAKAEQEALTQQSATTDYVATTLTLYEFRSSNCGKNVGFKPASRNDYEKILELMTPFLNEDEKKAKENGLMLQEYSKIASENYKNEVVPKFKKVFLDDLKIKLTNKEMCLFLGGYLAGNLQAKREKYFQNKQRK